MGELTGPVNNLLLAGKIDVLGTTDMTYVVRDGTLASDDELNELVRFTNFNDSVVHVVRRPDITGFSMRLAVDIDEQAHIVCALDPQQSNYLDLVVVAVYFLTMTQPMGLHCAVGIPSMTVR